MFCIKAKNKRKPAELFVYDWDAKTRKSPYREWEDEVLTKKCKTLLKKGNVEPEISGKDFLFSQAKNWLGNDVFESIDGL